MNATTNRPTNEIINWDREPVVGERVGFTADGPKWSSRGEGIYEGIRPSEWDGKPVHFFTDGILGVTPQRCFAFPVGTREGLTEVRPLR